MERRNEGRIVWRMWWWGVAILVVGTALLSGTARAQANTNEMDRILGLWLTSEGKAHIEVYKCDERYCGKIVWLKEPDENGKPKVDTENPVDSLRGQPILGMRMMYGFTYDEDNEWTGGRAYDPRSGSTYHAKLRLQDNDTMELRGYILVPLFGRTETWTRVKGGGATEGSKQ
jgi:uncharacterized protein (DUF2147 family)